MTARAFVALVLCATWGSGCANLRVPPITRGPQAALGAAPTFTPGPVAPGGVAAAPGPIVTPDATSSPALPPATAPVAGAPASTATPLAAAPAPAVQQKVPDPSPLRLRSGQPTSLALAPIRSFAPVGTEVVLVAGVAGLNGQFQTGRRIEWMLDPGGVGHFVNVDGAGGFSLFRWGDKEPRKIDRTYAVSFSGTNGVTLTRGTPLPSDDVIVYRGQTWASVSSPVEGTSYVTAFSRDVYGWDVHQQTALIEWVDAVWSLPPPAVNPVNTRHPFTTTVIRQSSGAPIAGWKVKYEIAGGPAAGFAPDGAQAIETLTNDLGQATAEIFQTTPSAGTNQINVSIIRPAPPGGGSPVTIATGATSKTWTAPDIAIQVTGPPQGATGQTLTYRIAVTNRGATAARGVTVNNPLQPGLTYVSSSPSAVVGAEALQWSLGDLNAGEARNLDVNFRADSAGNFNNCASVQTADGLTAQSCANTTVLTPGVTVSTTGPQQVQVGQDFAFDVTVTNSSTVPLTGLVLVDRFDQGLQHEVSASPIERPLQDLQPGQTQQLQVRFRATQAGQLCHTVEVTGPPGVSASSRACVTAVAAGGAPVVPPVVPPVSPPGTPPTTPPAAPPTTQPAGQARLTVTKTGPTQRAVGSDAMFSIVVTNTGPVALTAVKVADNYDTGLEPVEATRGFAVVGQDLVLQIDRIAPGQALELQVGCRCTQVNPRACNRVTVVSAEGARADAEACLAIVEATPGVNVTVSTLQDTIRVGEELTYEVRLNVNGQAADQDVSLALELPAELTPVQIGTGGPTSYRIEGQTIRFDAVPQIAPGQTVTFRVRARATRAGDARLKATVSSRLVPGGSTVEKRTTINP